MWRGMKWSVTVRGQQSKEKKNPPLLCLAVSGERERRKSEGNGSNHSSFSPALFREAAYTDTAMSSQKS